MDDAEAFELIDAHLDRQPLTDEQSDALTAWIKADKKRADEAFSRIFLHSYLRVRLQSGLLPAETVASKLIDPSLEHSNDTGLAATSHSTGKRGGFALWKVTGFIAGMLFIAGLGAAGWWSVLGVPHLSAPANELYAYEGFDYPPTSLPEPDGKGNFKWPTTGGLQGLNGGQGWAEPWEETNSKVAVIVDYHQRDDRWGQNDMRKFGPLGYSDSQGHVLDSTGNQMRTATSPRSISTRKLGEHAFPDEMKDELGLGRDGSVLWISFLAQSSLSTAEENRYSYVLIGSKEIAGLRIGKLGASPMGNWTAVGLQTGAEVNLRSSMVPSGEMVLLVTRIIFRPGAEEAAIWINPTLGAEPSLTTATMRLPVPDFRFDKISINANHSTDFDELRFGGTFQAVTPHR
ncbi:hypothetical protein [Planctomicrobium piriforme]|uniref:Uncharacterized protein n=1 Tax=Planctomicrobium piriforme TaxID=1576369 RepID=A0A1I3JTL7_9PLAN|nr:hypothetical protein [Planctomicrobium piriforme]SFI63553.1 hypothetical protein SAMN05421753_1118 [Planctomicrobium piriforme]